MLLPNEGAAQLDVVAGVTLEFAHRRSTLFDHVQEHLGELRVLVQVHQVGKAVVNFKCHAHFLKRQEYFKAKFKKVDFPFTLTFLKLYGMKIWIYKVKLNTMLL